MRGLIDAEYIRHQFYGSRTIRQYLRGVWHQINRTRVQRLMGVLGLAGMAPGQIPVRPAPAAHGAFVLASRRAGDTAQPGLEYG